MQVRTETPDAVVIGAGALGGRAVLVGLERRLNPKRAFRVHRFHEAT
jgi:hypothetical protein